MSCQKKSKKRYMISSAVRELGESFRYENLIYWARSQGINEETVKEELKELVKNKLLKVFFEIRCSECGAHLGDYEDLDETPRETICLDCGRTWIKEEDLDKSLEIGFTVTEKGKRFFRSRFYTWYRIFFNRKRTVEKSLRTMFERN